MHDLTNEKKLAEVAMKDRVLLISQCLRPSKTCQGKFTKEGLQCVQNCMVPCVIHLFCDATRNLGYNGVCVAAGGSMALSYVKERKPKGIIAVACYKELEEGVNAVKEMCENEKMPVIVVVPLTKVGCVDTEVDTNEVIRTVNLRPMIQVAT